MDFYYMPGSAACRSITMVAKTLGIELNRKLINLRAGDQLKPEFVKINPQHTVPTLVDNGFVLWESRAILIYLVEMYGKTDSLYPKNIEQRALINQRLYFDMGTLYSSFANYFYPKWTNTGPLDPEKLKKFEESLELFNILLENQTFAVGDSLTIADIALLASVSTFDMAEIDLSKYSNIVHWYENAKQVTPGWSENWEEMIEAVKNIK